MKIVERIAELKSKVRRIKSQGKIIGFVPTMGYLHPGHLSLVQESKRRADLTVVSVFVNPAQFGPQEDFKRYPRDLERDAGLLEQEGVDWLFTPAEAEMYPEGHKTYVEVKDLQNRLCGKSRPGHFRGVCTVVLKLFHLIEPDLAFFGQKDAQQAIILKRMVKDLDLEVKIEVLPIIRDEAGLALSSRNSYLTPEQKQQALCLSRSLREAERMVEAGVREPAKIIQRIKEIIQSQPAARIDYVEIAGVSNLEPLARVEGEALIALAVYIDKVRLIDNLMINLKETER